MRKSFFPMDNLPTYRASEVGSCLRALVAQHLNYEPKPFTAAQELILEEGKEHENLVIAKLERQGIPVTERQKELSYPTVLYILRGHIDGIIIHNSIPCILEIKALGRFTWETFRREGLAAFPGYAYQASVYSHLAGWPLLGGWPLLLKVKNRDTGQIIDLYLHSPPISFSDIIDKLNSAELSARDGELPAITCDDKERRRCRFSYLCTPTMPEPKQVDKSLIEAAELWREGKGLEKEAEEKIELAKAVFLQYCQLEKMDRVAVSGLSVSYGGMRHRTYLDEAMIKKLVPAEIWEQAQRPGKEYHLLTIRELSERG